MKRIGKHLIRLYYYQLSMKNNEESAPLSYYAVGNNMKSFNFRQFESIQPIQNWPKDAKVFVLGDVPTDFMMEDKMYIVSDRLRQALAEFGATDVQFLPLQAVHQESGEIVSNYWALHACHHVEGLNWEYTVWQKMRGTELEEKYPKEKFPFLYIMEPVFTWDKVKDAHVFQLIINGIADVACPIYISNEIKEHMVEKGVDTGVYFIKVPVH